MKIDIQKPVDQPAGRNRLITELINNLQDDAFKEFKIIVAFAKTGPLLRLKQYILDWRNKGNSIEAMIGVDEKGTSVQALEMALELFNKTFITHIAHGAFNPTFHSKIYLFKGDAKAIAYIGSNNLTVGGTETNSETHVKFSLDLPQDNEMYLQVLECWDDTKAISKELDLSFLEQLKSLGMVVNEKRMREIRIAARAALPVPTLRKSDVDFPTMHVLPPSPLPRSVVTPTPPRIHQRIVRPTTPRIDTVIAEGFVIQIVPRHNGEIFLSKNAINQNPDFFGFPFTGKTNPKISTNPSYPQRDPDPIVNISVFNKNGDIVVKHEKYALNTVYYEAKSEIRITVPQDVVANVPPYSILVMGLAPQDEPYDYDMEVYIPGSKKYDERFAICNQVMPSGGASVPRKFGWI